MPTATRTTLAEYMEMDYQPDREFVDGELRERNVGQNEHARLQVLLSAWFAQHEDEWHVVTFSDIRVQIAPTMVLIPDVLLTRPIPQPAVIQTPPVLCVEIISPDDTLAETKTKCLNYLGMGATAAWIIDPWKRAGYWSYGSGDQECFWRKANTLEIPGTPIWVDLLPLFEKIALTRS